MSNQTDTDPSLHDLLALGQLEVALAPEKRPSIDHDDHPERQTDEIRRLPLLLRMLSASQPLSSIPSLKTDQPQHTVTSEDGEDAVDPLVDQVVARLERVAASHAVAERVDASTSYHAPVTCRKISSLLPLKRDANKLEWNTRDLASVAASPLGPPLKKKRRERLAKMPADGEAMDEDNGDEDDVMSVDETMDAPLDQGIQTNEDPAASSDSQEAMTTKSLMEIAKLVVASLEPTTTHENKDEEDGKSSLLLPVTTDSLLSEAASDLDGGCAGAVGGFDFRASVAALMHHAPVLRHEHVANALCRAAAPQSTVLIETLGANCPSAIPCLLRGCIAAYAAANTSENPKAAIINTAKQSVLKLASLSYRESVRARAVLQQSPAMVDVQLELAVQQNDSIAVACLVNEHYSDYVLVHEEKVPSGGDTRQQQKLSVSTQATSDALSEASSKKKNATKVANTTIDQDGKPSLKHSLVGYPKLLRKSLTCLLDALHSAQGLSGRTSLLLRALSFLMLFGGTCKSDSIDDNVLTVDLVEYACKELSWIRNEIIKTSTATGNDERPTSANDASHRYLVCSCLSMYSRVMRNKSERALQEMANKCLEGIFDGRSISLHSDVFSSRVATMLKVNDSAGVCNLVIGILRNKSSNGSFRDTALGESFLETCKATCSIANLHSVIEKGTTDSAAIEDSSALLQLVQTEQCYNRAGAFVQKVLKDPVKSERMFQMNGTPDLIKYAVTFVTNTEVSAIPHVLPVQLQSLSLKIDWRKGNTRLSQTPIECQYILQLLYCLMFLKDDPKSPFAIEPRDYPLTESIELARRLRDSQCNNNIESDLKRLANKFAPEASLWSDLAPLQECPGAVQTRLDPSSSMQSIRHDQCEGLARAIREYKRDPTMDPSGCLPLRSFVHAQQNLTSTDLIVTTVQSLVGESNMPLPFMTYPGLCRDPLVLFKAPVGVWRCRGLLRIALFSLSTLLLANDSIITSASPTEEVASELLMSRDAIIVRCLIMASVGGGDGDSCLRPIVDSELVAMVREMVARHVGLVAQVVKQGRNDTIVDWIVDYVPESIQDSESFIALLSDRTSLTAAEKLETASAAIRIAIAHGSRNESAAKSLVYASLVCAVSSFFLIIGPVGVPLDALDDGDGKDVTQVCRNATFRILGALQNVRGNQGRLRNECGLALQKLANLCKGESIMAGVSGPVAGRRKQVLKDIYDAVAKAANSMGSGIKL